MSHQTGIVASENLQQFFADSRSGDVRLIQIEILNEKLELKSSYPPSGDFEQDYEALVPGLLEDAMPCYLFLRLDSSNNSGYEWIYISYSPDNAHIRQKMLYAGTRATLRREFGSGNCKYELFGTSREDVDLSGYKKHVQAQSAPAPLTMREEEIEEIKRNEVRADVAVDTKHQTLSGVAFPVSEEAVARLVQCKEGNINYVRLRLDISAERIELDSIEDTTIDQLPLRVPSDQPRYHLFAFPHTYEADFIRSLVFIYSMPGYKCSIKERMLYSSCKGPLTEGLAQLGIEIAKKLEIDDGAELSENYVLDELHPKQNVARQQFARPKGPGGRGPRRMVKDK